MSEYTCRCATTLQNIENLLRKNQGSEIVIINGLQFKKEILISKYSNLDIKDIDCYISVDNKIYTPSEFYSAYNVNFFEALFYKGGDKLETFTIYTPLDKNFRLDFEDKSMPLEGYLSIEDDYEGGANLVQSSQFEGFGGSDGIVFIKEKGHLVNSAIDVEKIPSDVKQIAILHDKYHITYMDNPYYRPEAEIQGEEEPIEY